MRAFGKGYEEFFERIQEEGVHVVRGKSAKVLERGGQMFLRGEDIVGDRVVETPVDMVLLSVGLQPDADAGRLARTLGIEQGEGGWFRELDANTEPTSTERGGIWVAGTCQGPRDIPDTVAQASAVAAQVLRTIVSGRGHEGRRHLTLDDIEKSATSLAAR
jgi:heterodisulfide reductase subunit A